MGKSAVLLLKIFVNLPFILQQQVPDKNFTLYLLSLPLVKVGGKYGWKTMTSHMRCMGVSILERIVENGLKKIRPSIQTECCMQAGRSHNPKVYKLDYFGHKMLVDQNGKLVMNGNTSLYILL